MDKKLAQRKHFPSLNWNISYSKYDKALEGFYADYDPDFIKMKRTIKQILQDEEDLTEIVQLVGKDSLSEDQKVVFRVSTNYSH